MSVSFRQLTAVDFDLYKNMETGLEDDYMLKVFDRLTTKGNALFGLFEDETLVAVAGYTLFAGEFAMLGRLRSDKRHRQNGYGTKITEYILNEARQTPSVKWIGANTELHNKPAQKVLEKIGLPHVITFYAAQASTLTPLMTGDTEWTIVDNRHEKRQWIEETYLNPSFEKSVFPYEAYYPFPARPSLFSDEKLDEMDCYINPDGTRVLFMWREVKGTEYLHVVYPWADFNEQPGLFETVDRSFQMLKAENPEALVWMDLTQEEADTLPADHPFDLPSPWMLHGMFKKEADSIEEANQMMDELEKELSDLNDLLDKNQDRLNTLSEQTNDLDSKI